jgi:hypothetical protein
MTVCSDDPQEQVVLTGGEAGPSHARSHTFRFFDGPLVSLPTSVILGYCRRGVAGHAASRARGSRSPPADRNLEPNPTCRGLITSNASSLSASCRCWHPCRDAGGGSERPCGGECRHLLRAFTVTDRSGLRLPPASAIGHRFRLGGRHRPRAHPERRTTRTPPRDAEDPAMGRVFDKGEAAVLTQPTFINGHQSVLRVVLLMFPSWATRTRSGDRC